MALLFSVQPPPSVWQSAFRQLRSMNSYNLSPIAGGRADAAVLSSRGIGATAFARPRSVPPPLPVRFAMPAANVWPYPPAIAAVPAGAEIQRAYGIGWFGVFVAWLATATLSAAVATGLPAHESARIRASTAAAIAPSGPLTSVAAVSGAPVTIPGAPGRGQQLVAAAAPPLFRISDLPSAPALAAASHAHTHAQPAARVAVPAAHPAPVERPRAAPAQKSASEEESTVSAGRSRIPEEAAPAAKQVVASPPVVVRSAPPASTFAAGSLEDLIRKEVDKEQRAHNKK
jgi:hypothetical protein